MMQIMLQHIASMKTAWAFEQTHAIAKLFENNPSGLPMPDMGPFYSQPLQYTPEEILAQGFLQRALVFLDPRYLEASLNWVLDPNQFQVAALMRPVELVNMLIETGNPDTNAMLMNVMQAMQLKPRLLAALNSDNPQTREVAVILIGQTKDANFSTALSKLLLDKVPSIRQAALKSLFQIDFDHALPVATELINARNQPLDVRITVISQLGNSNSLKAVPLLLTRFQDTNEREEIRQMAASSLGVLGATEAIPVFRHVLNDQNERTEARIGAIEGLKALNDLASIDLLLNRLQDAEERTDVRSTCATTLGDLAANQSVPLLLELIEHPNTDENLKYSAISALANLQDPNIIPRLTAYLKTLPATTSLAMQLSFTLDNLSQPIEPAGFKSTIYSSFMNAANPQLLNEFGLVASIPQYEPINKLTNSLDPSVNSQLLGSYTQRQALLTAMSLSDGNRNPALLRLAIDTHMSTSIRVQALLSMQSAPYNQTISQALVTLTQDSNNLIRMQSIDTLLKVLEGEDLLPWLKTPRLSSTSLLSGLSRYVATSPRTQATSTLLSFAQDDQSQLQIPAYQLLAELKATEALSVINSDLDVLEDEYRQWRQLRDQQPADLGDATAYANWQTQFEAATPKHIHLAIYYGYALAQMGFQQALAALNHDLADVRLGASFSLGKYASVQDLQALAQERAKHSNKPLFQQASYLALNQGLQRLELTPNPEQIHALATWQAQTKLPATDPVNQRLAWTLTLIKHYQRIDQEFASNYQLKRKL